MRIVAAGDSIGDSSLSVEDNEGDNGGGLIGAGELVGTGSKQAVAAFSCRNTGDGTNRPVYPLAV
jgi:hypothetical protein